MIKFYFNHEEYVEHYIILLNIIILKKKTNNIKINLFFAKNLKITKNNYNLNKQIIYHLCTGIHLDSQKLKKILEKILKGI